MIQRTMSLMGAGLVEEYREMILGKIVDQIDVNRLFEESRGGGDISEEKVDKWVRGAVESVERWKKLFSPDLGMGQDAARLRPTLTSDDFKKAFQLACAGEGIHLRETRNSRNAFVTGVFNFELPSAFRDPVFRPSKTMHVTFDRVVYAAVREQDLGTVRGQPIRPQLSGFGEPFTDWVMQAATNARQRESAFALQAPDRWEHGAGWLMVYSLRWMGAGRRLSVPDSLAIVFIRSDGGVFPLSAATVVPLLSADADLAEKRPLPPLDEHVNKAKKCAQDILREVVATKRLGLRTSAGISLLLVASLGSGN
jgi:hypothetical protein